MSLLGFISGFTVFYSPIIVSEVKLVFKYGGSFFHTIGSLVLSVLFSYRNPDILFTGAVISATILSIEFGSYLFLYRKFGIYEYFNMVYLIGILITIGMLLWITFSLPLGGITGGSI